jgi:hypothetical protein
MMGESRRKGKVKEKEHRSPMPQTSRQKQKWKMETKATLVLVLFGGIVSREAVVWSHGGSVVLLSLWCVYILSVARR